MLPVDFFSPPWLLRLLLPLLRALARSLCALLFWLLALPPLLAACARLMLPLEEEDLEFRDAIEMLLGCGADGAGAQAAGWTLGVRVETAVGCVCVAV
ncbi:MAG TPA: hypothetical protein VGE20_18135 [Ramlibacter sp.]